MIKDFATFINENMGGSFNKKKYIADYNKTNKRKSIIILDLNIVNNIAEYNAVYKKWSSTYSVWLELQTEIDKNFNEPILLIMYGDTTRDDGSSFTSDCIKNIDPKYFN